MHRVRLVFDIPCIGFARRYKRVLEAKGIEVIIPSDGVARHDLSLHAYAVSRNAIVVTTDKRFPDPKIVLPMYTKEGKKPKYEKWHTALMKELRRLRAGFNATDKSDPFHY
ncbi:MAG: hypothetical protein DRO39_05620 [Thermoprotei archaeon]|nr:MAG: hypothetical protein DRO39_05620 [Thermoprotei archaeon]